MNTSPGRGAVAALLEIYRQALSGLAKTIEDIPDHTLPMIIDRDTADENCKSVQSILAHVVHAAYGYATNIHNLKWPKMERPGKAFHSTIKEYLQDLDRVFRFTQTVFRDITDNELEQNDDALKIKTSWGQLYDTEQMMEHAIVHILRHRRQIGRIKQLQHIINNS